MMDILLPFVFFVGATIASFICLAVERLPHQLGWCDEPNRELTIWWPPSHCNQCKSNIKPLYLIPVLGYLLSRGKCGHCGYVVPKKYPAIELFCGGVCAGIYYFYSDLNIAFILSSIFLVLTFLTLIDMKETWLPSCVTYPLFWFGLLFSPFVGADERIWGGFVGCLLMYVAMKIVSILRKEDVFAGGDIALSAAAGAWIGIDKVPSFFVVTSLIFIAYSIPFRVRGIVFVPMGPAISVAFFLCLLYQQQLHSIFA